MPGLKTVLKPDSSVMVGLAEAAAVYVIYQAALPNHADIRSAPPHNSDIESARKAAAWKSAAVLGFVFLLTRDLNSFLIGGLALGGIDYMTKHANGISPSTRRGADAVGVLGHVVDAAQRQAADQEAVEVPGEQEHEPQHRGGLPRGGLAGGFDVAVVRRRRPDVGVVGQ